MVQYIEIVHLALHKHPSNTPTPKPNTSPHPIRLHLHLTQAPIQFAYTYNTSSTPHPVPRSTERCRYLCLHDCRRLHLQVEPRRAGCGTATRRRRWSSRRRRRRWCERGHFINALLAFVPPTWIMWFRCVYIYVYYQYTVKLGRYIYIFIYSWYTHRYWKRPFIDIAFSDIYGIPFI